MEMQREYDEMITDENAYLHNSAYEDGTSLD
jgi:hypothetical protein